MVFILICALLVLRVHGYTLVHNYDYTNWYESFTFETVSSIPFSHLPRSNNA
jgi:hypothetical protein